MSSMTDIIDEINRLHAEATPGPWRLSEGGCYIDGKDDEVCDCSYERDGRLIHAIVNNWPTIRDRLREAERKAVAFDAIARGFMSSRGLLYVTSRDGNIDRSIRLPDEEDGTEAMESFDLLTAVEAALRGEGKQQ